MTPTDLTSFGVLPMDVAPFGVPMDIALFGQDAWWVVLLKALFAFVLLLVLTLFVIVFERKLVGRMQHRLGPVQAGPFGALQSLADGMKLMFKEDFTPKAADKFIYNLAPFIIAIPAITAFSVIPFAGAVPLPWGGETNLQVADMPVSVLFIVAIAAVGAYGIVLAGWSSGSTYPLLGGLRSTAQIISYEIAMGLALVAVFLQAGSMSTSQIVEAQAEVGPSFFGLGPDISLWYGLTLFPSFLIYMVAMVGETNRAPFDMPEAEGELVAGFATEYSAMKYAMFFMAEYMNMITVSALATTMFLGGYKAPLPFNLIPGLDQGWWGLLWFFLKTLAFLAMFVWLRGTLPRVRYDQLMHLGWKVLIPVSLAWILIVASFRVLSLEGLNVLSIVVLVFVAVTVLAVYFRHLSAGDAAEEAKQRDRRPSKRFNAFAGGYPVPPMAGQELPETATVVKPVSGSAARKAGTQVATDGRQQGATLLEDPPAGDDSIADDDPILPDGSDPTVSDEDHTTDHRGGDADRAFRRPADEES